MATDRQMDISMESKANDRAQGTLANTNRASRHRLKPLVVKRLPLPKLLENRRLSLGHTFNADVSRVRETLEDNTLHVVD